jgi:hypothetical protein
MYLRICRSFMSAKNGSTNHIIANRKKDWARRSQFRKLSFAEVVLVLKKFKFAICDLRNLFSTRPPLIVRLIHDDG